MSLLKKLLYLLTDQEIKKGFLLMLMIVIMAILDMLGVASIMPFMAVMVNPSVIETNVFLNFLFNYSKSFGVSSKNDFLFFLGIFIFLLFLITIIFKALTTYAQLKYTQMRNFSISKRLIESYLHQPYSWFLNRNSAELGKSILSEVDYIVGHGLRPMLDLISKGLVVFFIIILLLFVDPLIALTAGFIFAFAYGIIYRLTRRKLSKIGSERVSANELRFASVTEAFGACKEIKLGSLEKIYIDKFSKPAKIFAKHVATSQILSQIPRFILEAITFGGMLLAILFLMLRNSNFVNIIPVLTLYAFAGYRLMPALQAVYVSIASLRFVGPALDILYTDLKNLKPFKINQKNENIKFNDNIKLENISYNYPTTNKTTLKNINLEIKKNTTIGIIGETGSGKSTTIDIILSLLDASEGYLKIDGKTINSENKRSWQSMIGYVPQQIYLADDTISANIAFGLSSEKIDHSAVIEASRVAKLHEFVSNDLEKGYDTKIGERGVRLSGGQRQRIGIARALYHRPEVLILDEATSALDNLTEEAVMEAVNELGDKMTIIIIAHRLTTVKKCNEIFLLSKGTLKDQGSYSKLVENDKNIKKKERK